MAKDIKLYKGNSEIVINESNLEQEQQSKSKKDKKWQHITEKKEL